MSLVQRRRTPLAFPPQLPGALGRSEVGRVGARPSSDAVTAPQVVVRTALSTLAALLAIPRLPTAILARASLSRALPNRGLMLRGSVLFLLVAPPRALQLLLPKSPRLSLT